MNFKQCIENEKFIEKKIDFNNKKWHLEEIRIPAEPGWYQIKTNTPIYVLENVGTTHNNNYDIPDKIKTNKYLIENKIAITQKKDEPYIVYSGQAINLTARAREHSFGGAGTGCLAIAEYKTLLKYEWYFCYILSKLFECETPNISIRNYGEQILRSKYGWPILCSQ